MTRCPFQVQAHQDGALRRPGTALYVERFPLGTPRCTCKKPDHWPDTEGMALRWINSGGSPNVLGPCQTGSEPCCPKGSPHE